MTTKVADALNARLKEYEEALEKELGRLTQIQQALAECQTNIQRLQGAIGSSRQLKQDLGLPDSQTQAATAAASATTEPLD